MPRSTAYEGDSHHKLLPWREGGTQRHPKIALRVKAEFGLQQPYFEITSSRLNRIVVLLILSLQSWGGSSLPAAALHLPSIRAEQSSAVKTVHQSPPSSVRAPGQSGAYYFVCFTEDGQTSRGDIVGDPGCSVTGLAGSAFITAGDAIRIVSGTLLFDCGNLPHTVVAGGNRITLERNSRSIVNQSGQISSAEIGIVAQVTRKGRQLIRTGKEFLSRALPAALRRPFDSGALAPSPPDFRLSDERKFAELSRLADDCLLTDSNGACRVIAAPGAMFSVSSRTITVVSGTMLLDAPVHTVVSTAFCEIASAKRFRASLRTDGATLCVENCSVPAVLNLSIKGSSLPLESGRCAIVKAGVADVNSVPLDGIARRGFSAFSDGRVSVITSDFLTGSLLRSNTTILRVVNHPSTYYENKLSSELLKGSAALMVATAGRGNFCARPANLPLYRLGAFMDPFAARVLSVPMVPRG